MAAVDNVVSVVLTGAVDIVPVVIADVVVVAAVVPVGIPSKRNIQ